MKEYPKAGSSARKVREPVQVYLDPEDQERLDRLRAQLGSNKSDVLRRGLQALERALSDPAHHPALRIIGIAGEGSEVPTDPGYDVAREHDRYLSEAEEDTWTPSGKGDASGP